MSPLTAKLKCSHGNGKDTHGAEAVALVAFDQDGRGWEDYPAPHPFVQVDFVLSFLMQGGHAAG